MKTQRVVAAIIGLLLATQTQAAEIKVLASTALKTVLEELGPNSISNRQQRHSCLRSCGSFENAN
jgi:hypothetical protein